MQPRTPSGGGTHMLRLYIQGCAAKMGQIFQEIPRDMGPIFQEKNPQLSWV